ncbi:radical SAM protein [Campylobacter pinnipediorum]|uniref:radical SAM protein n=1 Tax=Campylobacter pinnipediorum TaxID=1965231 RepID=UPI00084DB514|nr:radical SAM protein [Campylobacter pinnipediorum]AQW80799.1 radical SAM superfamily enzyme, MoaA/NifB/PqqE/SkfB family [Campylobacter pinnipediorum subsp. pinnipediorum]AQW83315.1 radical SAM superfamily enzyme, MoaA/NifB/PqqE/SkfB family [Campylobacter pinnipediorum subsp. pinnipediorum]OPA75440.1 hypothetical protein BFG05_06090 [Campylobacter pinnipediorum subsp. pinnipediorum]
MLNLNIRMTNDCNMNCSFCHLKEDMKNKKKIDIVSFADYYIQEKLNNGIEFSSFTISGGEPLLHIKELENLLNVLLKYDNDGEKSIQIMTNGTFIDNAFVKTFNEFENISFVISFDNTDNKDIYNLCNMSPFGLSVLNSISNLKNKKIRIVIDNFRDDLFELKTYQLYTALQKPRVQIALNYEKVKDLTIEDAYYLVRSIERFKQLDMYYMVDFTHLFHHNCNCSNSKIITPQGETLQTADKYGSPFETYGCSNLINRGMSLELYKVFARLIDASKIPSEFIED